MEENQSYSIKNWAKDDRPREKLLMKGSSALSNAELIAILIGSGSSNESAVELSKRILKDSNDNLAELSRLSIHDLCKFKGIGEAKAISILAALELGRRRNSSFIAEREQIRNSEDAFSIFRQELDDLNYECFSIILMNRANKVLKFVKISDGGITGTAVDPKKIFKIALEQKATSIILGHNHPSGQLFPSDSDIALTLKIREAGKLLEIVVLDHLIIAGGKFFSFADEGKL